MYSITLPNLIGSQLAMDLLYTGRRLAGEEAYTMGLCDRLVPADRLRETAEPEFKQPLQTPQRVKLFRE